MREGVRDVLLIIGVTFAGIQAYEGRNNLQSHPFAGPLLVAILFIIAGFLNAAPLLMRRFSRSKPSEPASPATSPIYIGPGGTPLWFVNEKVKVDLKLFTCTTTQLLHIKVNLGSSPDLVTLSDAEPEQIQSGKVFSKTLERTLADDELRYLQKEIILIQGTAKFSGNIEVPFVFQTVPWRA